MTGEEHAQKCSSTSSCAGGGGCGGGGGKRLKNKKIPQRGLGVAQLEKLRLEEQLKKDAALQSGDSDCEILFTLESSSKLPSQSQYLASPYDHFRQRSMQSCSSMVNASGISPLSSVMNLEPPSNQSYYGNNYTPFSLEDEKAVSLKRQFPFPLEIQPASPFHGRLLSAPPSTRFGESASCSNGFLAKDLQGANTMIRGSSSSALQLEPNSGKSISGNGCLDYGFLTLAPPTPTPRASEGCLEDPPVQRRKTSESTSGSSGQPPFFCFLPAPDLEIGQNSESNSSREVGKSVDLNLKL